MNSITMQLQADKLIRMALEEDITSEDVSTNAVMPTKVQGTVDLIAKEDGVVLSAAADKIRINCQAPGNRRSKD